MSDARQVNREAARWYVMQAAGEMGTDETRQWEEWCAASPENAQAWARLEMLRGKVQQVPPPLARARWQTPRRNVLKAALVLIVGGGAFWLWQEPVNSQMLATRTGERQEFTLADGSRVRLNTHSRVSTRYDRQQRLLQLEEGEIEVTTAPDAERRPFFVQTRDGQMQALGTRFTVRLDANDTVLAVQEHAVQIRPAGPLAPQRIEAGQKIRFSAQHYAPVQAAQGTEAAWTRGKLIVFNRPLDEVVTELGRHFEGKLVCAADIAHLRVSGTFSLDQPERSLEAIAATLPVRIRHTPEQTISIENRYISNN
jgi:transmembrane sensor